MPWHYPGYQRVDSKEAALKFESAWNIEPGGLNRKLGLTTTEIMSAVGPGGVRALYVMGENPMMSEPDLNHTRHKMEQLEFLVAQDMFLNETSSFADVFLPATSWAEKEGTFTNTDRRVQRVRKAIEPIGDSRPDWQIICDLAMRLEQRLGIQHSAYWGYTQPAEVLEEMGKVVPEYAGVKYPRLEKSGLQTPVWDDTHPGTPFLFSERFPRGRGKFHPLDYNPSTEIPDEDYPLILTTGRVLEHWHGGSLTRHSWLDDLYPEALIEINPADAAHLGLQQDGTAVRVTSRRGSIVLRCKVTQKTTPGVVFIPFHFVEAAANLLTIDAIDPQAKIPEYKSCAVRVVLADEHDLVNPEASQKRGRY
jgi:predicted molibdopterin-dependent oxidoreductase YjgC